MSEREEQCEITPELIRRYGDYLLKQEKSPATVRQYTRVLTALRACLRDGALTKTALIGWKEYLTGSYAAASVNAMLAAANSFLDFLGRRDWRVKPLKIQREIFCREDRELSRDDYIRLVTAANRRGDERLSLVLQSICATGIRVSELRFITAEAVRTGRADVSCKGKRRTIFLPGELRRVLGNYLKRQNRTAGPVFVTRSGNHLDRSNIWRAMKALCKRAGVEPGKVFPHNLRHLFARTYYGMEKDLSRLADILGHANINTTRIYTAESGAVHARQMGRMRLVIT